jgi:hypothetical protein
MENTARRLAKVLGGVGLEAQGHGVRFVVEGNDGARLKVNIDLAHQRFMAVLSDANGVVRADLDVAPVQHVTEDEKREPGRVTLHLGQLQIQIDSQPTLAVEVLSKS